MIPNFRIEQGYQPEWIDKVLEVFNKTEMKRSPELAKPEQFGKSPYLDWDRSPSIKQL